LVAGLLAMKELKTADGSNVKLAPTARAGACGWNSGSIRTVPVNHSAGPFGRWLSPNSCNIRFRILCCC
jgi:hypothetical protein